MRWALALTALLAACHTPRVSFDGEGFAVIEQKRKFFIGLSQVPVSDFSKVASLGFNVVTSPAFWGPANDPAALQALDEAQKAGLMVIAEVDTPNALRVKNEAFRRHPALLAWLAFTDPKFTVADEEVMKSTFREIIQNDQEHPIMMTFRDPEDLSNNWKNAKLIGIDIFPIPDLPLVSVPALVRQARVQTVKGSSVWSVIQLVEARHANPPKPKPLRRPTVDEVRAMTYLALIQQARGVLFFNYEKGELPKNAPELWKGVVELAAELKQAEHLFEQPYKTIDIAGSPIHAYYCRDGDDWFLLYANPHEEPAVSELELPAGPVRQLTLELKPYQAGIFKLTPEGKRVKYP
jgi:hypothetical protein